MRSALRHEGADCCVRGKREITSFLYAFLSFSSLFFFSASKYFSKTSDKTTFSFKKDA